MAAILVTTTVTDTDSAATPTTVYGTLSYTVLSNGVTATYQGETVHVVPGSSASASAAQDPIVLTTVSERYAETVTTDGPYTYTESLTSGQRTATVVVQTFPTDKYISRTGTTSASSATASSQTTDPNFASSNSTSDASYSAGTVTSATSTSSQSPSHSGSSSNKVVSTGALAGGIVGAAIGGAILAFLAACLLFRRKAKSPRGGAYLEEKPLAHPWDAYLPQSADDATIRHSVESLYSQIDMHVENYYSNKPAAGNVLTELLAKMDSTKLPGSVASLMASTSTPAPIIKHCFAWFILTQLSPGREGETSLLPAEFARLPPQLAERSVRKGGAREDQSLPQAYKYWRVLTAHLMYPRSYKKSININDIPSARNSIDTLSGTFAPWSKGGDAGREHLVSVVRTASETGLLLMSQPSSFEFAWPNEPAGMTSSITTFPALEKTADERGTGLHQSQVLIKSRAEAISKRSN